MKRVFVDHHHGALSYSWLLLFEKRLGWQVFIPIGFEWYKKGYWRYSQRKETIKQYLEPPPGSYYRDGIWYLPDYDFECIHKALTFKDFKKTKIDIIIATIHDHERCYFDLMVRYQPQAKFIRQFGNFPEPCDLRICRNLMVSSGFPEQPPGTNMVIYHQEFDLNVWFYSPPTEFKTIKTFINCFKDSVDYYLWPEFKKRMPDFEWRMHGIKGDDGIVYPQRKVRDAMRDSSFIWHVKLGGEGYGHVIHNAFALGRPVITKISYYQGKMAQPLLIDGETCIDLEGGDIDEMVSKIRYFSSPKRHRAMCEAVYKRFKEVVDFDREEKEIRRFLDNLI